jgi:hypothetical protein
MRTRYRDNMIDVILSAPEIGRLEKARDLLKPIAEMHPIRKELADASATAVVALDGILAVLDKEPLPIIDRCQSIAADSGTGPQD